MEHTKGPWRIKQNDGDGYDIICPDNSGFGTMFIAREICQGKDDGLADANLIATAPELLKALERVLKFVNQVYKNNPDKYKSSMVTEIEIAIAKAKGQ